MLSWGYLERAPYTVCPASLPAGQTGPKAHPSMATAMEDYPSTSRSPSSSRPSSEAVSI